jgi:hypothetical protein
VPVALGKDMFALGKAFAESNTQQRASVEDPSGKAPALGKDLTPSADGRRRLLLFYLCRGQHSAKNFFLKKTLCRVPQSRRSAKKFIF